MSDTFNNGILQPCLCFRDNIIIAVNKEFIDFTEFTVDEVLDKSIVEIGDMLKVNSQVHLDHIEGNYSGYIFTKSLSPREVDISFFYDRESNEKKYTFVEKASSRLDDKLIFVRQTFSDNISGAAVYSVPDLILLKANKKYLDFVDPPFHKEENSIGRPIREIINGFVGSQSEAIWKDLLETQKTSYIKELEFDKLTRGTVYFDSFKTPIFENGKMKYVLATSIEVTERVLKNQSIQQQKEIIEQQKEKIEKQNIQLTSIIENISDSISIFNNKGEYIFHNKAAREMFLLSHRYLENVGDVYKQAEVYDIDGERIDLESSPERRVMRGEKLENMRMAINLSHKTLQIDVNGTPIYDKEGKFSLGVICSRDMTCYLSQEETIRSQHKFLNRIIDTFELPVIRLSCPDFKIVDINKKAFNIIKLWYPDIQTIKQAKDKKIKDLFKTMDTREYAQCINEVLKEKKNKYLNKRNHFINGEELYWNVIFEPIIDVNGEVQEILILVIDVTAEIKSNLVMEKTLKSQGEFLANISHELKTPLNVISSAVQLFSMYCNRGILDENRSSIIKYIDSMKQNTYRLSKLINNIVDSSKIESGFFELNLSNNNIVEVVEEIMMSVINFTDSKGLNIIFDTDTEEKIIACDPEKIERIFLNLISNAIKFSERGNEIVVDFKDKKEYVEISVKDNGIGIETKDLGIIFDRFKQVDKSLSRNAEGTGIGLSLVKSIVELHGGHIEVESELGKGSKFTVVLPARRVMQESILFDSKMRNINESIQVEFSDVSS